MGTTNKSCSWPAVQKIFCTKTVCKQFICVLCPLVLWKCVVMVLQFKPYLFVLHHALCLCKCIYFCLFCHLSSMVEWSHFE